MLDGPSLKTAPTVAAAPRGSCSGTSGVRIYISLFFTCIRTLLLIFVVVSAVRNHNVARISKSYKSYGDRFTATVIEDLATSDLSQAVKGLWEVLFL